MRAKRYITEECIDCLVEWIVCHTPVFINQRDRREFFRGVFFIVDEEVRKAVERERQRSFENMKGQLPCSQ